MTEENFWRFQMRRENARLARAATIRLMATRALGLTIIAAVAALIITIGAR